MTLFTLVLGSILTMVPVALECQVLLRSDAGSEVDALAFSPDGHWLAVPRLDRVELWDLVSETLHSSWSSEGGGSSAAFSADSRYFAVADDGYGVTVWDIKNLKTPFRPIREQQKVINSVRFSPSGNLLAAGGDGGSLWLVNFTDKKKIRIPTQQITITALDFSPDGRFLATAGLKNIKIWSMPVTSSSVPLTIDSGWISALSFSASGDLLAAVGENATIRVWNSKGWKVIKELKSAKLSLVLTFFNHCDCLIGEDEQNVLTVWNTTTWEKLSPPFRAHRPFQLNSGDTVLAGQDDDFNVELFRVSKMQIPCDWPNP
jgi:WD40 repeat protein